MREKEKRSGRESEAARDTFRRETRRRSEFTNTREIERGEIRRIGRRRKAIMPDRNVK